jgi:hypothetical protein
VTVDYEAALHRIENNAIRACFGCGRQDATYGPPMLVALPDVGGGVIKDEGPEAYAFACTACGCIRLFAVELAK